LETKRFVVEPEYRRGDFVKTRLFENWIVRSLFKVDYHLLLGDLDPSVGVDELAKESLAWVSEGWAYAKQILMFPQGLSEGGRERRVPTLWESMAGSLGLV
jgi:hypothetical protein